MYFVDTCFYAQVFSVIRIHASNACISGILAFLHKYFYSSAHMLLMYVFRGHLLLCASIFSRPSMCIHLYGETLFGELTLEKNAGRLASFLLFHHYFEWE